MANEPTKIKNKNQTLNEFLFKEATQRQMSLSTMAQEIGIHHKTLTQTTHTKPRISTMVKIARYLNVNLLDLNLLPIHKKED